MVFSVAVPMTGGFFEGYALAVDASSSYADFTIPRVGLISNIERGYGEKISSLTVLSVHYPAMFIHCDNSLFEVFRVWLGTSIVVLKS